MIRKQTAQVFYAPTAGRRAFTLKTAVNAEARARMRKFYEKVDWDCGCVDMSDWTSCNCTYYGWIKENHPRTWQRYFDRLRWMIRAQYDMDRGRKPTPYENTWSRIPAEKWEPVSPGATRFPKPPGDDLPF